MASTKKCCFAQCDNRAVFVPVLVFPRYINGRRDTKTAPNLAKIDQPMCESCTKIVGLHTFLTESAVGYFRAKYAQSGLEFPAVSSISLEFAPLVQNIQVK